MKGKISNPFDRRELVDSVMVVVAIAICILVSLFCYYVETHI